MKKISGLISSLYEYVNEYLEPKEIKEKRKTIRELKKRAQTIEDKVLSEFLDAEENELIAKLPKALPYQEKVEEISQTRIVIPSNIKSLKKSMVEGYVKSKMNQLVLGNQEIKDFVTKLNKYYEQDFTKEENFQMENSILNFVLSLNDNFFKTKYGIQYAGNLDKLKIRFKKSELNHILPSDTTKDFFVGDYFPIFLLCNQFITTTKIFFQISSEDIQEDEYIIFETQSLNFERNNLGSILYYEFFSNKYKDLCYISSNFDLILNKAKEMIRNLEFNPSDVNSRFIKIMYNLGYQNSYINCNWFIYELLNHVININFIISGLIYDDHNEKYHRLLIEKDLENKIKKCLSSTQRYILIPLQIIKKEWKDESHQNILLIDRVRNLVERYEPHGTFTAKSYQDLNLELTAFFLKLGLEYKVDLCSVSAIQDMENQLPESITGKCVSLSYGYLNHRLENISEESESVRKESEKLSEKISPKHQESKKRKKSIDEKPVSEIKRSKIYPAEFAPIAYYNQINEKGITHWIDIEELNNKIFIQLQNYLDKINKIFDTSFYFQGNKLSFHSKNCKNKD
jgi:hypothetical protein